MHAALQSVLVRHDPFPWAEAIRPMLPQPEPLGEWEGPKHACLLVGSPKTLSSSTSAVLGEYVLQQLEQRGWKTESITLTASICKSAGRAALLDAVDRAGLLLFAFPLYVDALPFLMTRALGLISDHRKRSQFRRQRLVAIVNNGCPEPYHNYLALSICQRFAKATGIAWAGGLALGGGEGLIGGQALKPRMDSGMPATHVIRALNMTAAALALGEGVPERATSEMAKNAIPFLPMILWRRLFIHASGPWWDQHAAAHQVRREAMFAQPYTVPQSTIERVVFAEPSRE